MRADKVRKAPIPFGAMCIRRRQTVRRIGARIQQNASLEKLAVARHRTPIITGRGMRMAVTAARTARIAWDQPPKRVLAAVPLARRMYHAAALVPAHHHMAAAVRTVPAVNLNAARNPHAARRLATAV